MTCRWDREAEDYLTTDGYGKPIPCRRDEYGDPTTHCTARRTCSQHVGFGELTCARCLGRVRQTIRKIATFSALLPTAAEVEEYGRGRVQGANTEAAWLAAPAADPRGWLEYRRAAIGHLEHWLATGRIKDHQYARVRGFMDDDEVHPYNVLTRWHLMLAEDYGDKLPAKMSTTGSAAYLDRILGKVAQDEEQEFPLLRSEMNTCWNRVQVALAIKPWNQKGAPCPQCVATGKVDPAKVRLARVCPHWCDEEGCERFHWDTDEADVWRCPRNKDHWWTAEGYGNLMDERKVGA